MLYTLLESFCTKLVESEKGRVRPCWECTFIREFIAYSTTEYWYMLYSVDRNCTCVRMDTEVLSTLCMCKRDIKIQSYNYLYQDNSTKNMISI